MEHRGPPAQPSPTSTAPNKHPTPGEKKASACPIAPARPRPAHLHHAKLPLLGQQRGLVAQRLAEALPQQRALLRGGAGGAASGGGRGRGGDDVSYKFLPVWPDTLCIG